MCGLYRYPVKSLMGETLDRIRIDGRGLAGDRVWSVRDVDGKFGSGKSTRRFRRMNGLLSLGARYDGDVPLVEFPDGRRHRGDDPALTTLCPFMSDGPWGWARKTASRTSTKGRSTC